MNSKVFHIRWNLDKDLHRRAWEILSHYDHNQFHSYADVVARSLIDAQEKTESATREIVQIPDEFILACFEQLSPLIEGVVRNTMATFFTGLSIRNSDTLLSSLDAGKDSGNDAKSEPQQVINMNDPIPDEDIDWSFIDA